MHQQRVQNDKRKNMKKRQILPDRLETMALIAEMK